MMAVKKEEATLPQTSERASDEIWLGVILVTAGLISWIVSIHQKKRVN